eukprot:4063639-Pyramimonas_sp.AAC.1
MVKEFRIDNLAMRTMTSCIASRSAGRAPLAFAHFPDRSRVSRFSTGGELATHIRMTLQCVIKTHFRFESAMAARVAKGACLPPAFARTDRSAVMHYDDDILLGFRFYGSPGIGLNIVDFAGSNHARLVHCFKSARPAR